MQLIMQSLGSLLFAIGLVAGAAPGDNTAQNQIALWVPNPCNKLWDLPNVLRQSFIKYNQDKVPNLNVITAYSTYTVASASPGPTDTWSFNTQGATPVLTSAYNSAECSSYYPPPATSNINPTGTGTTATDAVIQPTGASSTTTTGPSVTISSTTTGLFSTTDTAATSETVHTGSTTSTAPSSVSTGSTTATTTLVTSQTSDKGTTDVPSSTSNTATSALTTNGVAAGASYTRLYCFEEQRHWVNETFVRDVAITFCQQVSDGKITPVNQVWYSPRYKDETHGVEYGASVRNTLNDSPAKSMVPNLSGFKDICMLEIWNAWKDCLGNGGWGGTVSYLGYDWTMQPKPMDG